MVKACHNEDGRAGKYKVYTIVDYRACNGLNCCMTELSLSSSADYTSALGSKSPAPKKGKSSILNLTSSGILANLSHNPKDNGDVDLLRGSIDDMTSCDPLA